MNGGSSLQSLQEGDEVTDLVAIEAELRHGRMPSDDAFRQGFLEHSDRIAFMQGAERWRDLERAWAHFVGGVTPRTIGEGEALALLGVGSKAWEAAGSGDEKAQHVADHD